MTDNLNKLAKIALEEAEVRKRTQNIDQMQVKLTEINEKISEISSAENTDVEALKSLTNEKELLMKQIAQKLNQTKEIDGPEGPEPTRYGDWEKKGIVSDF